jgi:hypothetical protein
MSSPDPIMLAILTAAPKPKADHVPTIRFDVPQLTTEQIVNSVQHDKPVWRTLDVLIRESIEDKRAKKLSDLYDLNTILEPEFETREFGI